MQAAAASAAASAAANAATAAAAALSPLMPQMPNIPALGDLSASLPAMPSLPALPAMPTWLREGFNALTGRLQNLLYHTHDDIDLNLGADDESDLLIVGNMPAQAMGDYKPLFLGYYTAEDMHDKLMNHVSKFEGHAGKTIGELLKDKGFTDIIIDVDASDTFVHRIHVYHGVKDTRHLIGQLFVRIDAAFSVQTMKSPNTPEGAPAAYRGAFADGLRLLRQTFGASMLQLSVIEWLRIQDPTRDFVGTTLPLPGQLHPNLGIGREVNDLLHTMAKKRGRDGLMNIPEHWHNAYMYASSEPPFRFLNPAFEGFFLATRMAVAADIRARGLPAVAWAISRGQLLHKGADRVQWIPHEQVFPITPRMLDYFASREYTERVRASFRPEDFSIAWDVSPADGLGSLHLSTQCVDVGDARGKGARSLSFSSGLVEQHADEDGPCSL
eukprot:m51a1_g2525 hypothetical protein (441) ;mRNA; r:230565-232362